MKRSAWAYFGAVVLVGSAMGCSSTTTGNSEPLEDAGGADATITNNPPLTDSGAALPDAAPDADAGDRCLRAFVTSTTYTGNLGGRQGGDSRCKARADAAGLGATAKWVAWLSSNGVDVIDKLPQAGRWCLVDGTTTVATRADLGNGVLKHAIDRFENGAPAMEPGVKAPATWTGTLESGKNAANNCDNWTKEGVGTLGVRGNYTVVTGEWTRWPPGGALPAVTCSNDNRLYCFEIE